MLPKMALARRGSRTGDGQAGQAGDFLNGGFISGGGAWITFRNQTFQNGYGRSVTLGL